MTKIIFWTNSFTKNFLSGFPAETFAREEAHKSIRNSVSTSSILLNQTTINYKIHRNRHQVDNENNCSLPHSHLSLRNIKESCFYLLSIFSREHYCIYILDIHVSVLAMHNVYLEWKISCLKTVLWIWILKSDMHYHHSQVPSILIEFVTSYQFHILHHIRSMDPIPREDNRRL